MLPVEQAVEAAGEVVVADVLLGFSAEVRVDGRLVTTFGRMTEREQAIGQTGRWWEQPWWPGHAEVTEAQRALLDGAAAVLCSVYDERWFLDHMTSGHPAIQNLIEVGRYPRHWMLEEAELTRGVQAAERGRTPILERLKHPAEYAGARREACVAAQLRRCGLSYAFTEFPKGVAGHDIDVLRPTQFHVEVTGVESLDEDERFNDFAQRVLLSLPWEPQYRWEMNLSGERVLQMRADRVNHAAVAESLAREVQAAIVGELQGAPVGAHVSVEIPGVGTISGEPGSGCELTGPVLRDDRVLAKAVNKAIKKSTEQLPKDAPGVVLVFFPHESVRRGEAERLLEERLIDNDGHRHLSGCVLVTQWVDDDGFREVRHLVRNPSASVRFDDLGWLLTTYPG